MYEIKIPRILFLALDVASFYKLHYFNTNDLVILANKYKKDLVRSRVNKKDYKYLDDTKFGGLRGNFSTLLTWKGLVKKGSSIVNYFSIGRDNRLLNAIYKGEIILDRIKLCAYTNDPNLKKLLELESWLRSIREGQAHIKLWLQGNPGIPLTRDSVNFPKESVVTSSNNVFFIRGLVNNYTDWKNNILEYSIINLWEGTKYKKKNLHLILVMPEKEKPWGEICAIQNEDLVKQKPFLLNIDINKKMCYDRNGNQYKLYKLDEAINRFSKGNANIQQRLDYDWDALKKSKSKEEDYSEKPIKEDEFSVFLGKFLDWKKSFDIDKKKVVDIKVSSSSGPDVILTFAGGTTQKLELEHSWKSYLDHEHHKDKAWAGSWIFSEEDFNKENIIKLFSSKKKEYSDRIPNIFLCIEKGEKKAYRIDWDNEEFIDLNLNV